MVTIEQPHQQNNVDDYLRDNNKEKEQQNINITEAINPKNGITIIDGTGENEETTIDFNPDDSAIGSLSLEYDQQDGLGCSNSSGSSSTDAICVRSSIESDIINERRSMSHTSSTQYSDIDDLHSLEEDDLGSWSNDLSVPSSSLEQHFDNGVSLPISEVPNFGDVSVKNSANVHFGNKTFYNGPVTIKQIVYANPNSNNSNDGTTTTTPLDNNTENKVNDDVRPDVFHRYTQDGFNNKSFDKTDCETPTAATPSRNTEHDFKATHWCAWLLTWRCVALMCAMGSCLVASVVVSVVLLSRDSDTSQNPVYPEIPESDIDGVTTKLRFVERAEWGAQPPTTPLDKLKHPVPYVIISHTATEFCTTQSECTFRVRFAQTFHIESRNWSDIAYNFLIGGDGYAYVGRGWDSVGAHSYGYNIKSIGISFVGTFNTVTPPQHQLIAAQQLIDYGVRGGKIASDYKLLGHRQISSTLSPGDALYNIMIKWHNWSPKP